MHHYVQVMEIKICEFGGPNSLQAFYDITKVEITLHIVRSFEKYSSLEQMDKFQPSLIQRDLELKNDKSCQMNDNVFHQKEIIA